ncbi:MAG: winged helix-turn-helix transcriptional regulator [Pyrinomonadaceae bacterium]
MNLPISSLPEENACGCADRRSSESLECMCPATGLVQIIGRKYSLRLLTVIGEYQSIRFSDLKAAMDDMSSSTLTIRLAELERAGLIDRQTHSETPPRVEYLLTTEGRKLRQNLFSISKYATRNPETPERSAAVKSLPEKRNG